MRKSGPKRKLTPEDVAMILELRSEGVRIGLIAYWVYGTTGQTLYHRLARYLREGFLDD